MLNLFFPQWQGSGNIALHTGAYRLYERLRPTTSFSHIPVSLTYSLTACNNILGYSQISTQLSEACRAIALQNPAKIFTLGGDCGVEIAPVSYLNQKYGSSLAVIWLDAHGDLNTPGSSPSGHFHGMPLRSLLGEGDRGIITQAFSKLNPEQVFLVGTRELDPPEGSFIQQKSLSMLSAKAVNEGSYEALISKIKSAGFTKLYIHFDLDVLDPEEFPYVACPTPNGVRTASLRELLTGLKETFEIVGTSVLEFLPAKSTLSAASEAITLLDRIGFQALSILSQ